MIGGQLEGFEACELGNPVVVKGLELWAVEKLTLPDGVVVVVKA